MKFAQALLLITLFTVGLTTQAETMTPTYSQGSTSYSTKESMHYGVVAQIVVSNPASVDFTSVASTDVSTSLANTYVLGLKTQATTTGTLPAGLTTTTDYFVIPITSTTFYLASSLANALAGTKINITDAGTGTHTLNPVALAGASIKLQCGSKDGLAFADIPIGASMDATKSASITATGNVYLHESDLACDYVRSYITMTAGQLAITLDPKTKGKVAP